MCTDSYSAQFVTFIKDNLSIQIINHLQLLLLIPQNLISDNAESKESLGKTEDVKNLTASDK